MATRCSRCNIATYASKNLNEHPDDKFGTVFTDGLIVPGRRSIYSRNTIQVNDAQFNKSGLTPGQICDGCIQELVRDGATIL
jgi:hypothetical protein